MNHAIMIMIMKNCNDFQVHRCIVCMRELEAAKDQESHIPFRTKVIFRSLLDFIFWASSSDHCLAALDLGAGVEQPFDSLIVQNRQSMQSMRRSMAWTFEDNMVDSLFFCGCSAAVKSDPSCFLEGQPGGVGTGVGQLLDLQPES